MLSSITPLGEQGRRRRWGRTVTAFVIASTLGGALSGVVAGAIGGLGPRRRGRSPAWRDHPRGRQAALARSARPLPRAHDVVAGARPADRHGAAGRARADCCGGAARMKLSAHGISVELPDGWEGKI